MHIRITSDKVENEVAAIICAQMADELDERKADLSDPARIKAALRHANFGERVVELLWQRARDRAFLLNVEIPVR